MTATFEILLHDQRVATLHHDRHAWITAWDDAWVNAVPRPIVSLKLLELRLNRPRDWGSRPPAFLTNLLPEADSALRRRLARTHGIREADDVAFLDLLGGDLSGALRVRRIDGVAAPTTRRPAPVDLPLLGYRASLGGMQLKFSAHRTDHISLPAHGEASGWILKLPPPHLPLLPAWEAATMSWARAVGFEVPEHHVEPLTNVHGLPDDVRAQVHTAFVIRRFDRPDAGGRAAMEEVCSILGLHPEAKYASTGQPYNLTSVGKVVRLFAGPEAAATFLDRVLFDAVAGNGDAHLKNWALTFPDGHDARLAPAYDIVPTAMVTGDNDFALALHGSRAPSFAQVHPAAIRGFATAVGVAPDLAVERGKALVAKAVATFTDATAPWPLPEAERARWRKHVEGVASGWV